MNLRSTAVGFRKVVVLSLCLCLILGSHFGDAKSSPEEQSFVEYDDDEDVTHSEDPAMNKIPDGDHDYVHLETDYDFPNPQNEFKLLGSGTKFSQLPDCTDEEPVAEGSHNNVLVSTLDGDITSLDLATGAVLWRNSLGHQALFSSSTSGLEVVTAGKAVQLVPTLDGMLYQVSKSNKLTALPVSADALRSSTYKFDDETYVTASYSSEAYGLYAETGLLVYKCDQDGCKKRTTTEGIVPAVSDSDDVLLITKTIRNVHAFDPVLGIQKFNYSVGEHQVELVRSGGCRASTGRKSGSEDPDGPVLRFSLSENFMQAERKDGSRLWTKKFEHAISGAWRLQNGELIKLDLLEPRNLYQLVHLHSSAPHTNRMASPDVYVGMVGQQKYVQQSERLRVRLHAFALANAFRRTNFFKLDGQLLERPSISWQPYLAKPPSGSLALTSYHNERRLALEYHPDTADTPASNDLKDVFVGEQLGGATETRLGPVNLPEERDLVTVDGGSRSNFGVYLFVHDMTSGNETPAIEGPGNNSTRGRRDHQRHTIAGPDPAPSFAWSFWGWFCSFFDWTLNLSYKMRLSAVMVQLGLLVLCLVLGVRVFSKPWCDWLVTFVLAPVVSLYALCSRWWLRWRQGPPAPEVEGLPNTATTDRHFSTDFYATSEHQQQKSPFSLSPINQSLHSSGTASVADGNVLDPSADHVSVGVDSKLAKFFLSENSPVTVGIQELGQNVDQGHPNKPSESSLDQKTADPNAAPGSSPPVSVPVGTPSTPFTMSPPAFLNQQSLSSTDSRGDNCSQPISRLDEFEIRGILGWGGFGVVFRAYVELDDNEYALKRIPLSNKEHHIKRVLREARVLAKLNHQNIVRYNVCWTQMHSNEFIKEFDARWKQVRNQDNLQFSYQPPEAYTSPPHTDEQTSVDQSAAPSLGYNAMAKSPNVSPDILVKQGNIPLENPFAMGRNAASVTTGAQLSRVPNSRFPNESSFSVNFEEDDSYIQFKETSQSQSDWKDHNLNEYTGEDSDVSEESNSEGRMDDFSNSVSGGGGGGDAADEDSFKIEFKEDSESGMHSSYGLDRKFLNKDGSTEADSRSARHDSASNSDQSLSGFILLEERARRNSSAGASSVPEQCAEDEEESKMDQSNGQVQVRPESLHLSGNAAKVEDVKGGKTTQQSQAYLYIQMELCDTKTLKEWLLRNTERPKPKVLKFFLDIVNAVEHIHDMHMMHRDLKPSNIFFSLYHEDVLKVGDLGLVTHIAEDDGVAVHDPRTPSSPTDEHAKSRSTMTERQQKQHTAFAGTTIYMSPEQLRKEEYDYKVDIYSMGLILFEMLWAMGTDSERVHVLDKVRELQFPEGFKEAHPEEYDLLQLMLHADPQKRPTTRGIRARPPLRKMQHPFELENIKESEHFHLARKHRRNTSSTSNHDVAEALAAAT
ncbi:Protein kinase domain [Trinorchestia longiramus]|nr:Protein kinase domain [Trinorchestia longiramus]